ncbi:MAG: hypothetical protein U1E78_01765 [Gammaproteobacteria bacterium]
MKVLDISELECVAAGQMNPALRNMAIFTAGAGLVGGYWTGDLGGVALFSMIGLLVSATLVAINDKEFFEYWNQSVIQAHIF